MKEITLLPCPFCGGRAFHVKDNKKIGLDAQREMVCCRECYAQVICGSAFDSPITNWNFRVQALNDSPTPVHKLKNERCAGRKSFVHLEKDDVLFFREAESMSYRKIADMCNISVGSVHKIINEHKKEGKSNDAKKCI